MLPIEPIAIHGVPLELASEGGDTWRCVQTGHAAPVQFNVRLWESDSSWEFWDWAGFRRENNLPPANCPDDLIGEFTQTFNENELLFALPQVGMWFEATKTLGSACGNNVCGARGDRPRVHVHLPGDPDERPRPLLATADRPRAVRGGLRHDLAFLCRHIRRSVVFADTQRTRVGTLRGSGKLDRPPRPRCALPRHRVPRRWRR